MPTLITRADDLGATPGANAAIGQAARKNFIRNISCMAAGPFIEEGAGYIRECRVCCFGLHAVLNSEWDRVKWLPRGGRHKIESLLTPQGEFPASPQWFAEHPPALEDILYEFDCQLDYLIHLKIPVSYVDLHMMPDRVIPGLREELTAWAARKGLIDHIVYYRTPSQFEPAPARTLQEGERNWARWLDMLEEGQYFAVLHPSRYGPDSLLMGNSEFPPARVAQCRDVEYQLLAAGTLEALCSQRGIVPIRYDEAVPPAGSNMELADL